MTTNTKIIQILTSLINNQDQEIEAYKQQFNKNPMQFLEWRTESLILCFQKKKYYAEAIDIIEGNSLAAAVEYYTQNLVNRRFHPTSSSQMDNIIKQIETTAIAELVKLLGYEVKNATTL